jgi:hypothetical protein
VKAISPSTRGFCPFRVVFVGHRYGPCLKVSTTNLQHAATANTVQISNPQARNQKRKSRWEDMSHTSASANNGRSANTIANFSRIAEADNSSPITAPMATSADVQITFRLRDDGDRRNNTSPLVHSSGPTPKNSTDSKT